MELKIVEMEIPEGFNIILGHSHFIKTVEDLYETLAEAFPGIKFGIAFCEASGDKLIRKEGTDEECVKLAVKNAQRLRAGHTFVIMLKECFPINVLNRIKQVSEVCRIFTATANPLQVIIAETEQGRGILGVIDGTSTANVETEEKEEERKEFLRKIGYKR